MPTAILPHDLHEACVARRDHPEHVVVAGGTDLMVGVNEGRRHVPGWISLRRVRDLAGITRTPAGEWQIGAGTTHATLAAAADLGALALAAATVGGPQIRTAGTLGGNVVTASPAGDTLPALLCLDAMVELRSVDTGRIVGLADFLLGPGRTTLAPDELVARIHLPAPAGVTTFAKVGPRTSMAISICSIAARLDPAGGAARVAVGSVAPTARRVHDAEALLLERTAGDDFAARVVAGSSPIDDHRASAAYRRHALAVVARRVHTNLWRQIDAARGGAR